MRHVLAILLISAGVFPALGSADPGSASLSVSARVVSTVGVRVSSAGAAEASGVRVLALPDGRVVTAFAAPAGSGTPGVSVQRAPADANGPEVLVITVLADGAPAGLAEAADGEGTGDGDAAGTEGGAAVADARR